MLNISPSTRSLWLLGAPVSHSLSPLLHNAVYRHYGWDWVYLAAEVSRAQLKATVDGLKALNCAGANVTVPHKEAILEHLDSVDERVRQLGAVNTLVFEEGRVTGHNTDGVGWLKSWDHRFGLSLEDRRIIVLGAGGSARSVYQALGWRSPAEIFVLNRTLSRAERLVEELGGGGQAAGLECFGELLVEGAVVIQTTSAGLEGKLPVDFPDSIPPLFACELGYGKPTPFLERAQQLGGETMDGLGMLIYQAVAAIELWSGKQIDADLMWQAAR